MKRKASLQIEGIKSLFYLGLLEVCVLAVVGGGGGGGVKTALGSGAKYPFFSAVALKSAGRVAYFQKSQFQPD